MNNSPSTYNRGSYEFASNSNPSNNEYSSGNGPLTHLSESVNSLDPLNTMEKSINEQVINFFNVYSFYFIWLWMGKMENIKL